MFCLKAYISLATVKSLVLPCRQTLSQIQLLNDMNGLLALNYLAYLPIYLFIYIILHYGKSFRRVTRI